MERLLIRELRLERGLTQEQLAKMASVSQPVLSQYESGHAKPSFAAVRRIALALRVSLDSIIGPTDRPTTDPAQLEVTP